MSACTHNLTNHPVTVLTSCHFQRVTRVFRQSRGDVICGLINSLEFTGEAAVKGYILARGSEHRLIENELTAWRLLCPHPNIASFIGTAPANEYNPYYMPQGTVSDYCVNGDLRELIPVELTGLGGWVWISQGLEHIHEQSVVHGDLKAANVLVDAAGEVPKICDFGSSTINCMCYDSPGEQEGTTPWDSPELMEEDSIRSKESDVWAFGCVALEVQMGIFPWDRDGNIHRAMTLQLQGGYPAQETWLNLDENSSLHQIWELMKECWKEEPIDRPKSEDLADWLKGLANSNTMSI